jgi:ketosteroid isomerase-like protein
MFEAGDPKVHVTNLFSDGGTVGVESYSTGKTLDGKVYENDYAWVFSVSNGKIDRLHEYMDSHYTAKLFGME